MAKDVLQTLADELEEVMERRAEVEATLAPIKEYEEQTREKLLIALKKKGYKFVKTTSGMGFGITSGKTTFGVVEGQEQEALEYVKTEFPAALAINKTTLAKILKPMLTLPKFFEMKEGEPHLTVRGSEEL